MEIQALSRIECGVLLGATRPEGQRAVYSGTRYCSSHYERLETENGNVGMEKITNSDINMYGNVKNDDKEEFNSQLAGKG